jgi:hypothetical protein
MSAIRTRKTEYGFVLDAPVIARTGIQVYQRGGKPWLEYRPAEEVFKADSLETFEGAPVTIQHPSIPVTSRNTADHTVGAVIGRPWRDGNNLRANVVVHDQRAIDLIGSGVAVELSVGYSVDAGPGGVTPDGVKYDMMQTNIRCNHLAIVPRGRAGVARFTEEGIKVSKDEVKSDAVDLQAKVDVLEAENAKLRADAEASAQLNQDAIDAMRAEIEAKVRADVAEEFSVNAFASSVGVQPKESTVATMRAVIAAVHPGLNLDGKEDSYVRTAYDVLKSVSPVKHESKPESKPAARTISAGSFLQ